MKFATAAALVPFLAAFTSAVPTPQNSPPPHRDSNNGTIIYPYATSTYAVWSGAINYGTNYGLVQKTQTSSDISTLVTFDFPASTAGRKCAFNFRLTNSATVTGTGQADVFTSLDNPKGSTTDWPQGNLRDQNAGRIQAVKGGPATLVMAFGNQGPFDCPAGHRYTGELVPTGDYDEIRWDVYTEGPEIIVY
ncbi:hypothetical protein GP486_005542 [Trichoglossum hirsutum]|uniref:Ubiquitin 3 binding protein But2 C-terminal domain-containing protein n=1 Tax=Trichoglossum hirsutum TaxID=265104 RepID=A0A9P8L921_9PEZI|nr:hypothetical protein GP486_005542 [Trichoglossum hirsutum]